MAVIPLLPQGTLDYTQITRQDILTRLQRLFNQANPEWEDFGPGFPENLLLEGMAFQADLIRGAMEERVRQAFWATLTDRLAAIRLGKLASFTLPGGAPPTLSGTFTLATGNAIYAVPIPEGTRVRTTDSVTPKRYRTVSAVTILVGTSTIAANIEGAELITIQFQSTGEPNQDLLLERGPYIDSSAVVTAADGSYTQYDSFLPLTATVKGFVTTVDDQGRAHLRFGNGVNGSVPQGTITVTYKIGGGTSVEVDANASWIVEDPLYDTNGTPVTLLFSNSSSSQPGADAMSVAEARVRGPLAIRTIRACVTDDDFEYVATSVPGIARAMLATSNNDSSIEENAGRLEVVALGTKLTSGRYAPASPSQAKLDEIGDPSTGLIRKGGKYPPLLNFQLTVAAATFSTVNISVHIKKRSGYSATAVAANIRAALADFFAVSLEDRTPNTQIDFGARLLDTNGTPNYRIEWSSVFNAILDAAGVLAIPPTTTNLLLNGNHDSVTLQPRAFPILGTITIYDDDNSSVEI